MASSTQIPEISKEPGPSNLRIVRVKRKRNLEAPEDLVIQDLSAPKKNKPNETLSDALGGLGLSSSLTVQPRPKRYRKLATMTAAEMLAMGPEKLQKMLTNPAPAPPADKVSLTDASVDPNVPPTTVPPTRKRSNTSNHIENSGNGGGAGGGNGERYEQIRRRRGLTNFEVTESAVDPLRGVVSVHDVVRMDAGEPHHQQQQKQRTSSLSQQYQQQQPSAEENTLLCNYLPMVREYLDEQQQQQQQQQSQQKESVDSMETDSGYVYDLYIEAENQYTGSTNKEKNGTGEQSTENNDNTDEDAWWEMHIRGGTPVVHIIDDDNWLVVEASDEEDSDVSSEDSNAEDYYGNDYPDEEEDDEEGVIGGFGGEFLTSSDDDGFGGGGGGGGRGRKKEWFDESGSDSDAGDVEY